MALTLNRKIFTNHSTIGDLFLDSEFLCSTLEDTCRNQKIPGETAIPSGRYLIRLEYSEHFKRPMPYLQNVPFYEGVMIHTGNTDKDVKGCIAVGIYDPKAPDFISTSRSTFNEIFPKIVDAMTKGPLYIEVTGGFSIQDFKVI